jgi:hypothetical protein
MPRCRTFKFAASGWQCLAKAHRRTSILERAVNPLAYVFTGSNPVLLITLKPKIKALRAFLQFSVHARYCTKMLILVPLGGTKVALKKLSRF